MPMVQIQLEGELHDAVTSIADSLKKSKSDTAIHLIKLGITKFREDASGVQKLEIKGELKNMLEQALEKKQSEGMNISIQGLAKLLLKQALQAELAKQAESEADLILKAKPIEGGEGDEEKEG